MLLYVKHKVAMMSMNLVCVSGLQILSFSSNFHYIYLYLHKKNLIVFVKSQSKMFARNINLYPEIFIFLLFFSILKKKHFKYKDVD